MSRERLYPDGAPTVGERYSNKFIQQDHARFGYNVGQTSDCPETNDALDGPLESRRKSLGRELGLSHAVFIAATAHIANNGVGRLAPRMIEPQAELNQRFAPKSSTSAIVFAASPAREFAL